MDTRLKLNALLDKILADGETFSSEEAWEIINSIPVIPPDDFQANFQTTSTGGGAEGYAEGIGNVQAEGDEETKTFKVGKDGIQRIGGYKIVHAPGELKIYHMWSGELASENDNDKPEFCSMQYNIQDSSVTISLVFPKGVIWSLGFLTIQFSWGLDYRKWKSPK